MAVAQVNELLSHTMMDIAWGIWAGPRLRSKTGWKVWTCINCLFRVIAVIGLVVAILSVNCVYSVSNQRTTFCTNDTNMLENYKWNSNWVSLQLWLLSLSLHFWSLISQKPTAWVWARDGLWASVCLSLVVSDSVCWCLPVSGGVRWFLVVSAGVCRPLVIFQVSANGERWLFERNTHVCKFPVIVVIKRRPFHCECESRFSKLSQNPTTAQS